MTTKNVHCVFVYPPSKSFADNPDAWWSWPGTDFDAEGRQEKFMEALRGMDERLDLRINMDDSSLWTEQHIRAAIEEIEADKPDGVMVVQFYNQSSPLCNMLIGAVEKMGIPVIYYVGLGVRHGGGARFRGYRRKGVRFIMSVDNFDAIEQSLAMIKEGRALGPPPLPDAGSQ